VEETWEEEEESRESWRDEVDRKEGEGQVEVSKQAPWGVAAVLLVFAGRSCSEETRSRARAAWGLQVW
jgi:hypothetical protein